MIDDAAAAKIREYAENHPEKAPIEILGRFGIEPSRAADVKRIVEAARDGDETDLEPDTDDVAESDESGGESYISDDQFENTTETVREHYRRMKPVYEALADVDGYPTTGVPSNRYWYKYDRENALDIDELEAGYKLARRPYAFESDFDDIVGRIEVDPDEPAARTLYTITSQKDREATYDRALAVQYDDFGSGDGLAEYADMRALPFWADIDLADDVKPRRGDLDDDEREAIEAAFGMILDEIAAVYGPRISADDVAAFDSGGGMYPWGPAATTLPIADHFEDDTGPHVDAREYVFGELADRMNAYLQGDATYYTKEGEGAGDAEGHGFEGIVSRVVEVVPEAADLLDVDGLMNTNRQSKAPGSIHKRHDVAVTPLRNGDGEIDYSPTLLSEVDDDVIDRTVAETERFTAVTDDATADETIASLIGTLFPEYSETVESDGWRAALETAVADKRDDLRESAHETALGELKQRRRKQQIREDLEDDLDRTPTDAEVNEAISSTVTPIKKDVYDAVDSIDVRDVIRDYASDEWDTSNRGHETTFDPSWRSSGSGMSCYVTSGERSTFGDNSCNGGGGPEKAYALGTGIMSGGSNAAARDMTPQQREKARNGLRRAGYEIPVYVPEKGTERSDGETYDRTPLWALRKAAVALDVVDPESFVERDGDDGGSYDWFPSAESFNATLEALDDAGIDHGCEPITGGGSGRAPGPRDFCEKCEPPLTAGAEPLDIDERREEMLGEAYDRFIETDDLTLWAYNPGEGKTTSGSLAAAERERPFVVALPKHENCREFQLDETKPDGCFHLKGAAQPVGDECMDATIDDRDCSDHGHGSNCPSMCPVYDLDKDEPIRILFDVFASIGKSRKAHAILGLYDEPWHGDSCDWLDQWDEIENVDRIVTVHQYLRLKSIREHGDILIDDIGGGFVDDETVKFDTLSRCRQGLRKYARYAKDADEERTADTLRLLEMFVDDLLEELADGAADLRDLEAPNFPATTRTYESREEIPDHVDEADITETRSKQYVGEGGQYVHDEAYEVVTKDLGETLAQARHFYEESVITAMKHDEWNGTPLCLDTVFGALAAALDDEDDARDARVAVETDVTLDSCPRCSSRLEARDGARMCDDCGWHEEYDRLTQDHTPPARVDVDVATTDGGEVVGLVDRRLPSINSLPDPSDVLILDATPQTAVYAAVFGVGPESVHVEGDDAYSLPNATVTQFTNGAYHKGTLEGSSVARAKMQKSLEKVNTIHDNVVYVSLKKVAQMFDWPDARPEDVMNYYSLRGLDAAKDADAIVLVGAPHPDESDLRAEGRLLALDNPGVRAGGRELSTRTGDRDDPDDDPGEPIYRKLNYVDDDGEGRAMAAKRYSGITGDLFDARHEDELVQAAHRIRPLLADATGSKHIYMFTNVPTKLPVDRVTTFNDFLDPLSGHVEVRDSALDLLGAMVDAATETEDDEPYATDGGLLSVAAVSSEWYEASERAGMDVSERTVRNALNDLRDAGLVEKGEYTQRGGYLQTLTRLGASVAAIRR